MNAFENLLVDNKFLQLANFQPLSMSDNFQHSTLTTFKIQQLSTFDNIRQLSRFNFEDSTTFNIQQLQYLTTFNNFQL